MTECYSKIFIENGEIHDRSEFDTARVYEGIVIYEVIRVRDGVPVFLSDHFERLIISAELSGQKIYVGLDDLRDMVLNLIELAGINNGNIKINFKYSSAYTGYLIYFIKAQFPDKKMYDKGVKGILYHAERKNPMIKIFNHRLRSTIYSEIIQKNAYEALLVNKQNCITEGSRSNVFFLKNNTLITAPEKTVLGGITRKKIISICERENFNLVYDCLAVEELENVDSVFMTGTSPNVLPFNRIDEYSFIVQNPFMKKISDLYMEYMERHIDEFRNLYK